MSLAKLMNESLLVVLPFRRLSIDPQFSIAESLAAGVPVVTTRVQSSPELIEEGRTGALVDPGRAEAVVEAVASLLSDRRRLEEMGRTTAARFAAQWNWTGYAAGLERVYHRVVRR